jgi:hypothetical protein
MPCTKSESTPSIPFLIAAFGLKLEQPPSALELALELADPPKRVTGRRAIRQITRHCYDNGCDDTRHRRALPSCPNSSLTSRREAFAAAWPGRINSRVMRRSLRLCPYRIEENNF